MLHTKYTMSSTDPPNGCQDTGAGLNIGQANGESKWKFQWNSMVLPTWAPGKIPRILSKTSQNPQFERKSETETVGDSGPFVRNLPGVGEILEWRFSSQLQVIQRVVDGPSLLIKIIFYIVKVSTNKVRQSDRMIEEQRLFQALKRPNIRFLSAFKTKQQKAVPWPLIASETL